MIKTRSLSVILCFVLLCGTIWSQDWHFKIKSKVELRSWSLSSRALKNSVHLSGASLKLYKGSDLIHEAQSDTDGNFEMNFPSDGEFTLVLAYQDQPQKKFAISTKGPNKNDASSRPSIKMVGMIMSKHIKDIKYLGLTHPQVMIEYAPGEVKNSEKRNYHFKSHIYDAEYLLIQKFCTASKLGDLALQRKDYTQAKGFYQMATGILDTESYPKDQLKRAEEGLQMEKASELALKKRKTKQNTSKQAIVAKQEKTPTVKKFVETGKSTRKTRQTLGK